MSFLDLNAFDKPYASWEALQVRDWKLLIESSISANAFNYWRVRRLMGVEKLRKQEGTGAH